LSEYGELLERESERFELAPGALDRLHRRRRRRNRNRRATAGVVAVAVAVAGGWLLVREFDPTSISVPATRPKVVDTFPVGSQPVALAVGQGSVWVADVTERAVFRLDPRTGEVLRALEIPNGLGPPIHLVAADEAVWVQTAYVDRDPPTFPTVLRFDPAIGEVTSTITLGHAEHARVAVGLGALWSGNTVLNEITGRDQATGEVVARIEGILAPTALAVGEGAVWVAGETPFGATSGSVWRIDPDRREAIEVSVDPGRPSLAIGEGAVWVASQASGSVSRIAPDSVAVEAVVAVKGSPASVATGLGAVWVVNVADDTVSRIDPSSGEVTDTVEVDGRPSEVTVGAGAVWVVDRANGTVVKIQE
jgi:YVTN family beta-propeller protein